MEVGEGIERCMIELKARLGRNRHHTFWLINYFALFQ